MREPLSDELFEVVLKQAVYDAEQADQAELPDSAALNETYPMPQSLQEEFAALRKKQQQRGERGRLAKRIAVIAVSLVTVVCGALMTQPEIRAGVSQIVVQQFQKFALFHHDDNGEPTHFLTVDDVEIGYVPEGYDVVNQIINETQRTLFYQRESNNFIISITLNTAHDIQIDNEHSYDIIYRNQREMHISYNPATQSGAIVIPDEIITIAVSGNIAKDELIRIAENMQ